MTKAKINWNQTVLKGIETGSKQALFQTGEALHTEIVQAQVMPFDTGTLQNTSTFVERVDENHVALKTTAPYAARLYYHPEYNFNTSANRSAGGRWMKNWLDGVWVKEVYLKIFHKLGGL